MTGRLRLYSGFVLLTYVCLHLSNHALGIVSLEAMNAGLRYLAPVWGSQVGGVVLYGALAIHASLGFYSLYQRRTLRMGRAAATQLVLGLLIPLMLATHVVATRGLAQSFAAVSDYNTVMLAFWIFIPEYGILQAMALIVVWVHAMIGMHMWLRLKDGYPVWKPWLLGLAVALPVTSLAGYASAGMQILEMSRVDGWIDAVMSSYGRTPEMGTFIYETRDGVIVGVLVLLAVVLCIRFGRYLLSLRHRRFYLRYAPGGLSIPLNPGSTVLECLVSAGVQHASVCGGKGRCSTCRVRIESGGEHLAEPDDNERLVLERVGLKGPVRLACQIRPTDDLGVVALIPPQSSTSTALQRRDHRQGEELAAAFLFVDLRGSTKLSEDRLPFDVVYILNQFFAELSEALGETNGHYAQFNGDGLMAIYGLEQDITVAAWQAIEGAQAMFRRLEALNDRMGSELAEPLRIGIGIHSGEAIVGSMGPPETPIISALGDNVNIAARLESQTKEFAVPLVISARTAEYAGIDVSGLEQREVPVKGRDKPVRVYTISNPHNLTRLDGYESGATP